MELAQRGPRTWFQRFRSGSAAEVRVVRVALAATGIVAILYAVASVVVWAFVTHALTTSIDRRLALSLSGLQQRVQLTGELPVFSFFPDRGGGRFAAPLHEWVVDRDGDVTSSDPSANLPASLRHAAGPTTAEIGGEDVRLVGTQVGSYWVVIGQGMAAVDQAQGTVLLAEAVVAPFLLGLVLLGAFTVGRRVAEPIEAARRRQLQFTADASHELRTPLAVIEAEASLALQSPRDTKWYQGAFARVDAESRRMRALVDDLLWLARLDSTREDLEREPVDLGVLATGTVDRFHTVAVTRQLDLAAAVRADAVVSASVDWLDRLLGVLVDNACRYTPEGGRVRVTVDAQGGRVRLMVEDSGPGIPRAERDRVRARFHRASDTPGGSGLGLAIADAIARATGGSLDIGESTTLGGARITVTWPLAPMPGHVILAQGTAT